MRVRRGDSLAILMIFARPGERSLPSGVWLNFRLRWPVYFPCPGWLYPPPSHA